MTVAPRTAIRRSSSPVLTWQSTCLHRRQTCRSGVTRPRQHPPRGRASADRRERPSLDLPALPASLGRCLRPPGLRRQEDRPNRSTIKELVHGGRDGSARPSGRRSDRTARWYRGRSEIATTTDDQIVGEHPGRADRNRRRWGRVIGAYPYCTATDQTARITIHPTRDQRGRRHGNCGHTKEPRADRPGHGSVAVGRASDSRTPTAAIRMPMSALSVIQTV